MKFCESIFHDFKAVSNTTLAIPMEKYMKNKFVIEDAQPALSLNRLVVKLVLLLAQMV